MEQRLAFVVAWNTHVTSMARNSRNASPSSARICTGPSTWIKLTPEDPKTIPAAIITTTDGMRNRGTKPMRVGAQKAIKATKKRFANDTSHTPVSPDSVRRLHLQRGENSAG